MLWWSPLIFVYFPRREDVTYIHKPAAANHCAPRVRNLITEVSDWPQQSCGFAEIVNKDQRTIALEDLPASTQWLGLYVDAKSCK